MPLNYTLFEKKNVFKQLFLLLLAFRYTVYIFSLISHFPLSTYSPIHSHKATMSHLLLPPPSVWTFLCKFLWVKYLKSLIACFCQHCVLFASFPASLLQCILQSTFILFYIIFAAALTNSNVGTYVPSGKSSKTAKLLNSKICYSIRNVGDLSARKKRTMKSLERRKNARSQINIPSA